MHQVYHVFVTTSWHALKSLNSHCVCCCYCAACAQLVMVISFMPHPAATQMEAAEHSLAEQQRPASNKASRLSERMSDQQSSAARAPSKARSTTLGPLRKAKPPCLVGNPHARQLAGQCTEASLLRHRCRPKLQIVFGQIETCPCQQSALEPAHKAACSLSPPADPSSNMLDVPMPAMRLATCNSQAYMQRKLTGPP